MNQSESPPVSGLVAGKYQLVRMIGRGGMGSVWEARHATLGTPVAIKFIEPEYADSNEAKSRFEREAKAAAAIQSKNAIQIHDHGIQEGRPFIVMELLQGTPLDKKIEELALHGTTLTLAETSKILQQVCRGLQRAHERGIVHRDLKPENIFLVQDEDGEIAKVLDFGIAKLSNGPHNPSITSSTKTGAVLGTPFYMSPEQARGLRNVDHRTDIWSLGVIAFKCVTGKLPFDGESVGDLLVKICTSPVPRPSEVRPGLPQDFDAWFAKALEREPERRFASVAELAQGLATAAGVAGSPSFPHSNPFSSGPTVAQQHQMSFTPPQPGQQGGGTPGYAATPQPAALTASPFTSSQRVPGVPASRWKPIAGVAVVMLLVGAGAGGFWKFKYGTATNAVGIAQNPPAPPPVAPTPPPPQAEPATDTATPTQISTIVTQPATPLPAGKTAPVKPGGGGSKPVKPPAVAPPPAEKPVVVAPPPPPPAEKPTPPPPPGKKPPRTSDPGY